MCVCEANPLSLHGHILSQSIHDWHLAVMVLALVVVDLVILSAYTTVEGVRGNLETIKISNRENPTDTQGVSVYMYIATSTAPKLIMLPFA